MSIKSEVTFSKNNFNNQTILSEEDSIIQLLNNLFTIRPGQMPSMPHIGINIKKYLYSFDTEIDTEALRQEIVTQGKPIIPYLNFDNTKVLTVDYRGESILMIILPIYIDGEEKNILYGAKKSGDNDVTFNYQIQDAFI